MPDKKMERNNKDGLALIVGGVFILALVFATYNYFNKGSDKDIEEIETESVFEIETEGEIAGEEMEGDLNGPGISTEGATGTGGPVSPFAQWVANDYQEGDIQGGSYTVVEGDTLWEIAEAAYGDGTQWNKILEANSSNIGYLPNGQQALIRPDQVLVLP